jgi:hypothetical protein
MQTPCSMETEDWKHNSNEIHKAVESYKPRSSILGSIQCKEDREDREEEEETGIDKI